MMLVLAWIACEACRALRPTGAVEWGLVSGSGVIVLGALVAAVRFTVHPGEGSGDHVKRTIFEDESR